MNKYRFLFLLLVLPISLFSEFLTFLDDEKKLEPFYEYDNILLIASTGRSGSTLLNDSLCKYARNYHIVKTHILPPNKKYQGKIIFIFSNPDKAAESTLHLSIQNEWWGTHHFYHVKSSDHNWLLKIESTTKQTLEDNLLAYDALGCRTHLVEWLYLTTPSAQENAQILAIKYENLWDSQTIDAIKTFLKIDDFALPVQNTRGCKLEELDAREILFRQTYNLGTEEDPIYQAYDLAREIWKKAPAVQYLNLS